MTSDANAKLPIPTYRVIVWPGDVDRVGSDITKCDDGSGPWCDTDDVRGLVERMEKAEAQRDRLVEAGQSLRDYLAWTDGGRNFNAMRQHDTQAAFCAAFDEALAAIDKEPTT